MLFFLKLSIVKILPNVTVYKKKQLLLKFKASKCFSKENPPLD